MKKYNNPTMEISRFAVETVATSDQLSSIAYYDEVAKTANAGQITWSQIAEQVEVQF